MNLFCSIKNSGEMLDKLKARDSVQPVCLHMIFLLYALLDLIILLKINLLILLKKTFNREGSPYFA